MGFKSACKWLNAILGQWNMRTDLDNFGTRLCPVPADTYWFC